MYDLTVDGVAAFYMRRPGSQRYMPRQPLAGIVDGVNTVFKTPMYPVLASPFAVYLGSSLVNPADYTLDATGGVVTFDTAPTVQPTADYTALAISVQQIIYYAWAGFQLMESLWSRTYVLSSHISLYAMATPLSANIYLAQGPLGIGAAVAEPLIGTQGWSSSFVQRAYLERCMELAYLDSMSVEAALSDVNITERGGGIAIRTDHRSGSILNAKKALWHEIESAKLAALDENYPDGRHYGGVVTGPHTDYYAQVWNWQSDNGLFIPASSADFGVSY